MPITLVSTYTLNCTLLQDVGLQPDIIRTYVMSAGEEADRLRKGAGFLMLLMHVQCSQGLPPRSWSSISNVQPATRHTQDHDHTLPLNQPESMIATCINTYEILS